MNSAMLKAEIARRELSIPRLADLIGIGKKALYDKMEGKSEFKQTEIVKIAKALNLTIDETREIFFAELVS